MEKDIVESELAAGAAAATLASPLLTTSILTTAVQAGLVAGSCDLLYAMLAWSTQGVPAKTIPLSIASGVLGKSAFAGGAGTIALGITLHFIIAFVMAAAFVAAAALAPVLAARPLLVGACYGVVLYLLMNFVVVPLSKAPLGRPPLPMALADLTAHMILVGIPIALITARSMPRS